MENSTALGPQWADEPVELANGYRRIWMRSGRYALVSNPAGKWTVCDQTLQPVSLTLPLEAARMMAEELDARRMESR